MFSGRSAHGRRWVRARVSWGRSWRWRDHRYTAATIHGRLLAQTAAVNMDTNAITTSNCASSATGSGGGTETTAPAEAAALAEAVKLAEKATGRRSKRRRWRPSGRKPPGRKRAGTAAPDTGHLEANIQTTLASRPRAPLTSGPPSPAKDNPATLGDPPWSPSPARRSAPSSRPARASPSPRAALGISPGSSPFGRFGV
jgi:hypothetical protein